VYPTEITDDLCVIELYARWFEARGFRVVLGSPFNLRPDGAGGVSMFGVPCPVVWRHYKTDWWGERRRIWRSEPEYADAMPLAAPLAAVTNAVARGRCAVVNPFGAVVTQNKRLMALMWEELGAFSAAGRAAIQRYVPLTVRMETVAPRRLREQRRDWVLKSDYGCEGEEVVIGAETTDADWSRAVAEALPGRWIAQRRFEAPPLGSARAGNVANYGVYVVAGRAAGLFTRLQGGATDRSAQAVPTFIKLPA
jgi:glutathionylspermidine synthase